MRYYTIRRILDNVNNRFICRRLPLLHVVVMIVQLLAAVRLIARFEDSFHKRPVLTTMVTNAILGGIADTLAQTITAVRARLRQLRSRSQGTDASVTLELDELPKDQYLSTSTSEAGWPSPLHKHHFSFPRMTRFMSIGFMMAPIQFQWYIVLLSWFPVTSSNATWSAVARVACDQFLYVPICMIWFFAFMAFAEGGGMRAFKHKMRDAYLKTLKVNYIIWPAIQVLNFRVIPMRFQIPFVSTIGIAWTVFLSLTNSVEEEEEHEYYS